MCRRYGGSIGSNQTFRSGGKGNQTKKGEKRTKTELIVVTAAAAVVAVVVGVGTVITAAVINWFFREGDGT